MCGGGVTLATSNTRIKLAISLERNDLGSVVESKVIWLRILALMRDNDVIDVRVKGVNIVVEDGLGVVCVAAKCVHHMIVVAASLVGVDVCNNCDGIGGYVWRNVVVEDLRSCDGELDWIGRGCWEEANVGVRRLRHEAKNLARGIRWIG